jgi:hypothetical protein
MALPDYHVVERLDATGGLVTRVAGSGISGYSGGGGPATSAQLQTPSGVVIDSAGDLYIVDIGASVVRKVSGGVIATVAGTGMNGFTGDNMPAASAQLDQPSGVAVDANFNLYIADSGNFRIRKVSGGIIATVAGDGNIAYPSDGPATGSRLHPLGVAVDAAGDR